MLAAMCEWGLAHNKAYIRYIEDKLALKLTTDDPGKEPGLICWKETPQADRYRNLSSVNKDSADSYYKEDMTFEEKQAKNFIKFWLLKKARIKSVL